MSAAEGVATAASASSQIELQLAPEFSPLELSTSLGTILGLDPPPFRTADETFLQLEYLADYIRRPDLSPLKSRAFVIESHYVDRDFMADHSVLFSSTLRPPPNHCRRIHFFAGKARDVEKKLMALGPRL